MNKAMTEKKQIYRFLQNNGFRRKGSWDNVWR